MENRRQAIVERNGPQRPFLINCNNEVLWIEHRVPQNFRLFIRYLPLFAPIPFDEAPERSIMRRRRIHLQLMAAHHCLRKLVPERICAHIHDGYEAGKISPLLVSDLVAVDELLKDGSLQETKREE